RRRDERCFGPGHEFRFSRVRRSEVARGSAMAGIAARAAYRRPGEGCTPFIGGYRGIGGWHLTEKTATIPQENAGAISICADATPLRVDEDGAVRVGNTRIRLDLVVEQYENGMSPEDMVRAYDTLSLADVHATIAYYLRHREEV